MINFARPNKLEKITFCFLIPSGILLSGFLIAQLLFKPEVWSNYLWIPVIGMVFLYIGIFIKGYEVFPEIKRRIISNKQ